MSSNAYYRITPEGNFLKKEDYRFGFGLDTSFYNRVHEARKKRGLVTRDEFTEDWDTRSGFDISGKKLNTRFHPLHNLRLIEKNTNKTYVVDSVHKHHYLGSYILLLIRAEGSKSHSSIIWEIITCKNPSTLASLKEARKRFIVKQ